MIVDTREPISTALDFSGLPFVTEVVRDALPVGDYMVQFEDGTRPPISFERKAIGDLFGTMTQGHKRFKREIERATDAGITLTLIIEGTLSDVLQGVPFSQFDGDACVRKLMTLYVRYGIQPVFCKDRIEMVRFIYESFCAIGRNYKKNQGGR